MAAAGAILEGLPFVRDQLAGLLPREIKAVLRRSTAKIAANVRNDIRAHAPRQTGNLKKAITSRRRRGTRDQIEAAVFITHGPSVRRDAFYWHFLEYGTVNIRAQPFVVPAAERARSTYRSELRGEIRRQVIRQLERRAQRQRLRSGR